MPRRKPEPPPAAAVDLRLSRQEIRIVLDLLALVVTYPGVLAAIYSVASGDLPAILALRERLAKV